MVISMHRAVSYIAGLVLFLGASFLQAATLVCDWLPYSEGGADYNTPDAIEYSADGGTTWSDFVVEINADRTMFRMHEPFDPIGEVDWLIRAKNTYWGRYSATAPFTWGGEGPLTVPAGFSVIP